VSYTDAAVAALNAGCDLALLCNQSVDDPKAVDALLDGLAQAQREGRWQAREASEQRRLALLPAGRGLSWDALMAHPDYMHALDLLP
jgi:beta-N-acetylhexosaminidase